MADEGEEDGGRNGGADESVPLIVQQQQEQEAYLFFRQDRQAQNAGGWSVCSARILLIFKVVFCSLGLWGDQKWNYIPRVLFVMICITQAGYQISADCGCPYFDCNKTHHNNTIKSVPQTRRICFTVFSPAAFFSYLVFLVCLTASSRSHKDSVVMSPSKSMDDVVDRKEITLLFLAFIIIMALFLSGMVLLLSVQYIQDPVKHVYMYVIAGTTVQ